MAQMDPDNYKRLGFDAKYGEGNGLFYEEATGDIVIASNGEILHRIGAATGDGDEVASSRRCVVFEDFVGKALNVTDSIWGTNDTSSGGTPTIAIVADAADGKFALAFDNTSEAQVVGLDWNDELNIDVDKSPVFICKLSVDANLNAADEFAFGFAGAQNDTLDNIAQNAWFRLDGAMSLLLESDDGTTDTDDQDTGVDLVAATEYEFKIDVSDKSDVKFYYRTTLDGAWTALLATTTFDISAYSGNLQPLFQLAKSSGAQTTGVKIDYVKVSWDRT